MRKSTLIRVFKEELPAILFSFVVFALAVLAGIYGFLRILLMMAFIATVVICTLFLFVVLAYILIGEVGDG